MLRRIREELRAELVEMTATGTFKHEHQLDSPQSASVTVTGRTLLNFSANDYLGLANHGEIIAAAKESLDQWGFGMASVRFISGTQTQHARLEQAISDLLGTEAAILYPSCFDANGGVFEALLDQRDAVISDELNHASIIDGIRLSKASRHRYRHRDMEEMERVLRATQDARRRLVVTDGVFSMDGSLAPLRQICQLAERYDAMVMVDDSHAVGVVGPTGAGTPELLGVGDRVDIVSGTLGKALGGASGGYVGACAEVVETLRQRSRPYLFSNALSPTVVGATLKALDLVRNGSAERERLHQNAALFRRLMIHEGFDVLPGDHPIVPVVFGDALLTKRIAAAMVDHGIYVVAFSYPVVATGKARIRVQLSAAHTAEDLRTCVRAFVVASRDVQGRQSPTAPTEKVER